MAKIWENKAHSFKEAEEFDDRFWRKAGAQKRFEASWLMLIDLYKMKGVRRGPPRLKKSVEKIIRCNSKKSL